MTAVLPGPEKLDAVASRVERLNTASARRLVEPDEAVPGTFGPGQVIPDELLSVAGLALDLTPEQRARLSREETGSILQEGIRFEAVLMAGVALLLAEAQDFSDPRIAYMLHEMGEETATRGSSPAWPQTFTSRPPTLWARPPCGACSGWASAGSSGIRPSSSPWCSGERRSPTSSRSWPPSTRRPIWPSPG